MTSIEPEIRSFVVGVIGLSLGAWRIAFNLGAYHTVFYDQLFSAWVMISVILLLSFFLDTPETTIGWQGRLMLAAPTLVILLGVADQRMAVSVPGGLLVALNVSVLLISLPLAIYIATELFNPQFFQLSEARLKFALVIAVVAVLWLGYYAGVNNDAILTCGDFRIAGDDTPANCRPGPPATF